MRSLQSFIIFISILVISTITYGQTNELIDTTDEVLHLPLSLHLHLQHIFIGSGLILSLMCFAWARALRSYSMALLALYFSVKSLWILADGGITIMMLIDGNSQFLKIESSLLATASLITFLGYTAKLFDLKRHNSFYYQSLRQLSLFLMLTIPVSHFLSHANAHLLMQILNSFTLLTLLYIAHKLPNNFSHLPVIYSMMLIVQLSFNLICYVFHFAHVSTQIVNGVDMLAFWSMAIMVTYMMGRRYYGHLQDEKSAQQQALAHAKASEVAQGKLLSVQQEGQELLESRVQERTLELNIALQELEVANQELKEKTTFDELSGLYNRRYYDQKILAEFRRSRRNLTPLSLILVDIDHFKKVNDNYGHLTGDKCIVETAKTIKFLLRRSTDVGCRYGGEEFCLILPETDEKGALALAQEVCQNISQQQILSNENIINLTVSCGVTTYQQEKNVSSEIIFASADRALYKAKQAGRNQVHVSLVTDI